jgi:hypothetical protein
MYGDGIVSALATASLTRFNQATEYDEPMRNDV